LHGLPDVIVPHSWIRARHLPPGYGAAVVVVLLAASLPVAGRWLDLQLAQQPSCRPGMTCCTDPDGRSVPPGTVIGPYICRPDGTWGPRPR
jgi:hypothetical protein